MRKSKKKNRFDKSKLDRLIHFFWMIGGSKNVQALSRVFFPLPDLSRKIEKDSARRVGVDTRIGSLAPFTCSVIVYIT